MLPGVVEGGGLGVVDDVVDEAEPQSLLGGDDPAGEAQVLGRCPANAFRQEQRGDGGEDAERDFMRRINDIISDWINDTPEQWLWIHRRWKTRPKDEAAPTMVGTAST